MEAETGIHPRQSPNTAQGLAWICALNDLRCHRCGARLRPGWAFAVTANGAGRAKGPPALASHPDRCLWCTVRHPALLRRSAGVALVVGTALTLLNQGDILLAGRWHSALYWKIPLTYCVPFIVATYGALSNSRR